MCVCLCGIFSTFYTWDHIICKQRCFYFFLSFWMLFISSSYIIVLTVTSSTELKLQKWASLSHSWSQRKSLKWSFISSIMLVGGFSYMTFIMLRLFASIPSFSSVFNSEKVLNFITWLFCISWDDHVNISPLLVWCITFIDFHVLSLLCIPE